MSLIGAILSLTACFYAGVIKLRSLREREICLHAVTESLMHIRNAIARTNAALPEIFSDLSRQCTGHAGRFFAQLEKETGTIGERRFQEIWRQAVSIVFTELDKNECGELEKLGFSLGCSDGQTQVTEIQLCENIFLTALAEHRQELPQKKKLVLGLSVTVGAFTVILLI